MGKNPATATSTANLDSHATEAGPAAASAPGAASTSHAADAASSPAPYLQVRDLCKHYGEGEARATVLHDVTATVNKGEICVLLGPSGSGKSTFLNLVGGLEAADSGSINVGGTELTSLTSKQLGEYRRDKLGFVFQFYNLVPDLTIRENIEVTAHLSANPLPIDDLLHSLGLYEHRAKFPRQVSGGQQQRCAIGRALVKNPGLLLCDEPTGALDYITGKAILKLLQDTCRQQGMTVVVITHNTAIAPMADKVIHVKNGRVDRIVRNENPMPVEEIEW